MEGLCLSNRCHYTHVRNTFSIEGPTLLWEGGRHLQDFQCLATSGKPNVTLRLICFAKSSCDRLKTTRRKRELKEKTREGDVSIS